VSRRIGGSYRDQLLRQVLANIPTFESLFVCFACDEFPVNQSDGKFGLCPGTSAGIASGKSSEISVMIGSYNPTGSLSSVCESL
jgi:hypothetical protein